MTDPAVPSLAAGVDAGPAPDPTQPELRLPPRQWVKANLFRTPADGIITVVVGSLLAYFGYRFLRFVLVTAEWEIVRRNLTTFMVGRYDRTQLWRPSAAVSIGAAGAGLLAGLLQGVAGPHRSRARTVRSVAGRTWPLALLVVALLALTRSLGPLLLVVIDIALILGCRALGRRLRGRGRTAGFVAVALVPVAMVIVLSSFGGVPWGGWGGLLLNVFLAAAGISLCFPLGLVLALGRRSNLPVARVLSVAYIELFRGVPLVALILMGVLTLGFFVPQGLAPGDIVRVIAVFTVFTSAYVAEIVRGGLQSVPRGQTEAAKALGLSPTRITAFIVLPQALRASIPALVGQFISLFKDTSLVFVVGLPEVLRVAFIIPQQADFRGQGRLTETLVFAMFVFWVGSYTMSRESQRLERRFGVGER
ncbi:MAG TPA: amino acid ABC transporter permease [Acidimicrobiales bacterium]|nr:amino acid ABC transporter permease [Acidimicrobiales bacterium]